MFMRILAINCGSSTLKFELIEADQEEKTVGQELRIASGIVDLTGGPGAMEFTAEGGEKLQEVSQIADHGEAMRQVLGWLHFIGLLEPGGIQGIGHRVVHGGDRFHEPVIIDEDVIESIEALRDLAPLHNGPSVESIRAARAELSSTIPMVAIFDTMFHRT